MPLQMGAYFGEKTNYKKGTESFRTNIDLINTITERSTEQEVRKCLNFPLGGS